MAVRNAPERRIFRPRSSNNLSSQDQKILADTRATISRSLQLLHDTLPATYLGRAHHAPGMTGKVEES
jgi:hypothetical protein